MTPLPPIIAPTAKQTPAQLRLLVDLYDPDSNEKTVITSEEGVQLSLPLVGPPIRLMPTAPAPPTTQPLDVLFNDGIQLTGITIEPSAVEAGATLNLTLLWQANAQPSQAYTVFIHLIDESGTQLTTGDSPPVQGDFPTILWQAGDWVDDLHTLTVPPNTPPGSYRIQVGLYNPVSGVRLTQANGDDKATIPLEIQP